MASVADRMQLRRLEEDERIPHDIKALERFDGAAQSAAQTLAQQSPPAPAPLPERTPDIGILASQERAEVDQFLLEHDGNWAQHTDATTREVTGRTAFGVEARLELMSGRLPSGRSEDIGPPAPEQRAADPSAGSQPSPVLRQAQADTRPAEVVAGFLPSAAASGQGLAFLAQAAVGPVAPAEAASMTPAGGAASPGASATTAPLNAQERSAIAQIAAQHGGDWALLNDAAARAVVNHAAPGADGKLDIGRVIGGSAGVIASSAPPETRSFPVMIDPTTGAMTRGEEVMLGGDNGMGLQFVPFSPPADAIIETHYASGGEGEIYATYSYRPGAETLAREARRAAALDDLNAQGLIQVIPNAAAGGSLGLGADGIFRSPGAIRWDDRFGLVTTQAQPPAVAPRYLDATQTQKFDLLTAQYGVSAGSSWEQVQPPVLTRLLDTATIGADGKLDLSRAFGGRIGYVPMESDPYGRSFQVFTDSETGALYRYETVPGGGEGGDSSVMRSFEMPPGGRLVTETVSGSEGETYSRQMYVPSQAAATRAETLQAIANEMNRQGIVQVQAGPAGPRLAINEEGGYRDPSRIGWDDNLGLITNSSNIYYEEDDSFLGGIMDMVEDVMPIVIGGALIYFGGTALAGALAEGGVAAGAAAGTAAGETAAGIVTAEAATGTVVAGTTAAAPATTSIWATQIGTTTLGNLAGSAATNFGVSLAMNGGDIDAALRSAGIGMLTAGAGALAGGAAAGVGAGTAVQNLAQIGTEAIVRGSLTGDMEHALLGGVASLAGGYAGEWAAGQVAEQMLNGANLPDWSAQAVRTATNSVVSGAIRGDLEGGLLSGAMTFAGAALTPEVPIGDTGKPNELGLTAAQMNGIGNTIGSLARGYITGGERGLAGAAASLVGGEIVDSLARGETPPVVANGDGATSAAPAAPANDPLLDFMVERGIIDPTTGLAGDPTLIEARMAADPMFAALVNAFSNPYGPVASPLLAEDFKPWARSVDGELFIDSNQLLPGVGYELPDNGDEATRLAALEPADLPGSTRVDSLPSGWGINMRPWIAGTITHRLFASEMNLLNPQAGTLLVASGGRVRYMDLILGRDVFELKPISWQFDEARRASADVQVLDYVSAMNNNVGHLAFFGRMENNQPRPYQPGRSDQILQPNTPDGGMRLNSVLYDGKDFLSVTLYPDYRERSGQRTGLIFYELNPMARTPELEARLEQARQQNLVDRYGGFGFISLEGSGRQAEQLPSSSVVQQFINAMQPPQRRDDPLAPFDGRPSRPSQPIPPPTVILPGIPIRIPGVPPVIPPPSP